MKFTNRSVDQLGRIAIPAEIRDRLNIFAGNKMDIEMQEDKIIITNHVNRCSLCGNERNLKSFYDIKFLCNECIEIIKRIN